ncbi:YdcF family protein [Rhizobium sp. BK418]|uniref:YdcF family protein n=1 Tax=Rhizobium sp. BK418 TaxID=2512120 RepID=UPI0010E4B8E7|nr:YdcF family protein [Rhizobium sp. BK418]TCS02105.1 uncharacterized SAM-binding protein YcdF (DUF218 family) [Rhizobium sp. BK418]
MTMGHTTRNPIRPDPELERPANVPSRRGPIRRVLRWVGFSCVLVAALIFVGFLRFADSVTTLKPPAEPRADAIIVLTGGYQRIDQAVELLQKGAGKRLLISGAHPSTTPNQIRRMTQGSADLFSCCVDIGYDALDTIGNAEEASNWIHARGYRSILVVTNNYHMPRSLAELAYVDPDIQFIPYPVVNSDLKTSDWFTDPNALRVMLAEYAKVLLASARNIVGLRHTGLRSASLASQS